jgi:hypothetical protein
MPETPLSAALDRRGDRPVLHRPRRQQASAGLRLFAWPGNALT